MYVKCIVTNTSSNPRLTLAMLLRALGVIMDYLDVCFVLQSE